MQPLDNQQFTDEQTRQLTDEDIKRIIMQTLKDLGIIPKTTFKDVNAKSEKRGGSN